MSIMLLQGHPGIAFAGQPITMCMDIYDQCFIAFAGAIGASGSTGIQLIHCIIIIAHAVARLSVSFYAFSISS